MSARRLVASAAGAALVILAAPLPAAAHALGQAFTLPVPLTLYLLAAAAAVAASFVVAVVVVRPAGPTPTYRRRPVREVTARWTARVLAVVGVAWWFGTIAVGFLVDPVSPLAAVLFWIVVWVGLPIVTVLAGNPWPSLSPFRTVFNLLERGARIIGFDRIDLGLRYPPELARWPAVGLLFVAVWCELVLPDRTTPQTVASLLTGYTLLTLGGMALFGRVGWLRNVELFEIYLGWFGRVGPIGRRVVVPEACADCAEACDPATCVDCPECAAVAERGERQPEMRPWFTGLTEVRHAGWSDAAFIVLALAAVSFDGFSETSAWGAAMNPLFSVLKPIGPFATVLVLQTAGLLIMWLGFLAAFSAAAYLTRAMHDRGIEPEPLGATAGAYAATLLPIASGYLIAHYLTLLVQGLVWLPELVADPLSGVVPPLDWMPISAVWYLSVGAIVLGHVVAVVLAHRLALRDSPGHPVLAGLPLVILMIGYTVLSLWIIAQPITLEPGSAPAAFLVH